MTSRLRTKSIAAATGLLLLGGLGVVAPAQAAEYPPVLPQPVSCKAQAVSKATKIKITMGPALAGTGYYTFRLDKKTKRGWTRYLKTYRTKGGDETRTINVRKGTWRAKCYGKAFPIAAPALDATSNAVKIRK